jgi:hypothetical protein
MLRTLPLLRWLSQLRIMANMKCCTNQRLVWAKGTYPWPKQICWSIEDKVLEKEKDYLSIGNEKKIPRRMHFVAKKICGILQEKYLKMPSIWDIELFFKAAKTLSNSLKIPRCRTNFISYYAKPKTKSIDHSCDP